MLPGSVSDDNWPSPGACKVVCPQPDDVQPTVTIAKTMSPDLNRKAMNDLNFVLSVLYPDHDNSPQKRARTMRNGFTSPASNGGLCRKKVVQRYHEHGKWVRARVDSQSHARWWVLWGFFDKHAGRTATALVFASQGAARVSALSKFCTPIRTPDRLRAQRGRLFINFANGGPRAPFSLLGNRCAGPPPPQKIE